MCIRHEMNEFQAISTQHKQMACFQICSNVCLVFLLIQIYIQRNMLNTFLAQLLVHVQYSCNREIGHKIARCTRLFCVTFCASCAGFCVDFCTTQIWPKFSFLEPPTDFSVLSNNTAPTLFSLHIKLQQQKQS